MIRLTAFVALTIKVLAAMVADLGFGAVIGASRPIRLGLFARHLAKVFQALGLVQSFVV